MMLETPYVRPITFRNVPAFRKAQLHYLALPDLDFDEDVIWYFQHGWVHSSPSCFALACVINIAPKTSGLVEPAWFIRYAIGNFTEILSLLPCRFTYIVWCRDNEDHGRRLRKWRTDRLFGLAKTMLRTRAESGNNRVEVANAGSTPAGAAKKVSVN